MPPTKRAFYRFHASLMEPWDGPASIAFTDGTVIGAVLDRNGLRPSRYWVTDDDRVIMASEAGVVDVDPATRRAEGPPAAGPHVPRRHRPGPHRRRRRDQGRARGASSPYGDWLRAGPRPPATTCPTASTSSTATSRCCAASRRSATRTRSSRSSSRRWRAPAASRSARWAPTRPIAVLSDRLAPAVRLLPAAVRAGHQPAARRHPRGARHLARAPPSAPRRNLLEPGPESCRRSSCRSRSSTTTSWPSSSTSTTTATCPEFAAARASRGLYRVAGGGRALARGARPRAGRGVSQAIAEGERIIVLSDRDSDAELGADPVAAAHLGRAPPPDPREDPHPGRARRRGGRRPRGAPHGAARRLRRRRHQPVPRVRVDRGPHRRRASTASAAWTRTSAVKNYIKAAGKGVLKVMSKMGISTVASYTRRAGVRGDRPRPGARRRVLHRHRQPPRRHRPRRARGRGRRRATRSPTPSGPTSAPTATSSSAASTSGAARASTTCSTRRRCSSCSTPPAPSATTSSRSTRRWSTTSRRAWPRCAACSTLPRRRARRRCRSTRSSRSSEIVKRFATGAMSYGSISKEAHETLAIAMNRIGGKSNTGEGGEDADRYAPDANGDLRRSAIKQVASGRFGVTSRVPRERRRPADQDGPGRQAGRGRPAARATRCTRGSPRPGTRRPGVGLISPPPHHDIYSIEDLKQLIHDLKNANPRARVHVKLVAEVGVGTVAAGVVEGARRRRAHLRATTAAPAPSPLTSLKHAGAPWELGLAETQQTLLLNGLRDRIVVQVRRPAEDRARRRDRRAARRRGVRLRHRAARGVSGCVMMRVCHLDTCPVGVATQNPELRKRFTGKPEFVVNFFEFIAEEVRELPRRARLPLDRGGRRPRRGARHPRRDRPLEGARPRPLADPRPWPRTRTTARTCYCTQGAGPRARPRARPGAHRARPQPRSNAASRSQIELPIRNVNRTVGTMLGSELTRRYGGDGLPDDTIDRPPPRLGRPELRRLRAPRHHAAARGRRQRLHRQGPLGRPHRRVTPTATRRSPPRRTSSPATSSLYGATGGEAYFRGVVGERFCVRNSGATAVVEGVGDHGCEYMTGGRVVVLGPTGRNFGAGMSGGIAYVYDPNGTFPSLVNYEMVELEPLDDDDREWLSAHRRAPPRAHRLDGRRAAARRLGRASVEAFRKVMPKDYKRVLDGHARGRALGLSRGGDRRRGDGGRRMGETDRLPQVGAARRRPAGRCRCACATGRRSTSRSRRTTLAAPGRALHGLRHPVLQQRLPARQPHPRLERPRLPRPLARRDRAAPRHQQLPRVHRPPVPGAVRGRVRARHQPGPGHHQAGRGRDRRPGVGTRAGSRPQPPTVRTGKRVAVVGSGPAGLAAAQQLTRAGHDVVVFERADRIGGLLRYGIPEFKMEKRHLDRRLDQMRAEGTEFRVERRTSASTSTSSELRERRSTPSCSPAARPRGATCRSPVASSAASTRRWSSCRCGNRVQQGDIDEPPITAEGKHVVIIGGGDTGADCLGTSHRQGAASVHQFEILPRPPDTRGDDQPVAAVVERSSARRRRTRRAASASTASTPSASSATTTATCAALRAHEVEMVDGKFEKIEGTDFELPCELVLLAMGFVGPEQGGLLEQLGVELDARGNVARDAAFMTNVPGVFVCGDMGRGQSLIVWAIAEGRSCAAGVDTLAHGRDARSPRRSRPRPGSCSRARPKLSGPRATMASHRGRSTCVSLARCGAGHVRRGPSLAGAQDPLPSSSTGRESYPRTRATGCCRVPVRSSSYRSTAVL